MADLLVETPATAKKVIEAALKKSMGLNTVTVTSIKVDGVALDLSRRLAETKEITVEYAVECATEEVVKSWHNTVAVSEDGFAKDLISEAVQEGIYVFRVISESITLEKVVVSKPTMKSVAAVTQAPPPEDEAGSAWRQAMPSCMAITALLWASSN